MGYAFGDRGGLGVEAGVIGSYRVWDLLEPYAGVHFANHWFQIANTYEDVEQPLPRGQGFAERRGYGDGLVKANFGVD